MEGLHRIGVKLFCSAGKEIDLAEFIPVFHRWIQQKRSGMLLVDVADYSHVPRGPGVMLVAHEGNFSIDEQDGERGLSLVRKQPLGGSLDQRIATVARDVVSAASALCEEPEFKGRLEFEGSRLRVLFNDRLLAPNTEAVVTASGPHLDKFFSLAFGKAKVAFTRETDPRARLCVTAESDSPAEDLAGLAGRLASR